MTSRSNWNLEVRVFVEGGKPENPEKNPRFKPRTSNKLNPHETASTGIEIGSQRREASAYPLRQPCSHPVSSFPWHRLNYFLFLTSAFPHVLKRDFFFILGGRGSLQRTTSCGTGEQAGRGN